MLTIRTERDYAAAIERLDSLVNEIGEDEQHPLYGLLDTLGTLIHAYEEEHVSIPAASGPEVLEYLMEEHDLTPEDLPELGRSKERARGPDGRKRAARWRDPSFGRALSSFASGLFLTKRHAEFDLYS